MFTVYIIYSEKLNKFYIGYSSDVQERLRKHNRRSKGFSSLGRPWVLVYTESFDHKKDAMDRERQLKNWKNRERIETLIRTGSEHPD
jgi:putative endonuclease